MQKFYLNLYITITAVFLAVIVGLSLHNYEEWKAVNYEGASPTYIEVSGAKLLSTWTVTVERTSHNLSQSVMGAFLLTLFLCVLFWVRTLICKKEKNIAQAI